MGASAKAAAVAGLAALLISAEGPAFAAAAPVAASTQGDLFEQLVKQQKEGKSKYKHITF